MTENEKGLILIVDDEEMVRLAIEMVLNSEGYRTICACDGQEGIDLIRDTEVDLVITDVKMPRANGLEVLKAAKMKNPNTKVIMITGFTSQDPSEAFAQGADEFLYKVFKREDIIRAVKRLLGDEAGPPEEGGEK